MSLLGWAVLIVAGVLVGEFLLLCLARAAKLGDEALERALDIEKEKDDPW